MFAQFPNQKNSFTDNFFTNPYVGLAVRVACRQAYKAKSQINSRVEGEKSENRCKIFICRGYSQKRAFWVEEITKMRNDE
ncbi:MAG: hypothetical protein EAZ76_05310 [Nostocales cyanobacterium]|nr:MAG: hypothetical protein EAZ87_01045 [Nostocales cyanobacterium]TAF18210.1 MAG: hypothetical protein EAZ76_05310 [Nostocales cyanobacterium]